MCLDRVWEGTKKIPARNYEKKPENHIGVGKINAGTSLLKFRQDTNVCFEYISLYIYLSFGISPERSQTSSDHPRVLATCEQVAPAGAAIP